MLDIEKLELTKEELEEVCSDSYRDVMNGAYAQLAKALWGLVKQMHDEVQGEGLARLGEKLGRPVTSTDFLLVWSLIDALEAAGIPRPEMYVHS